MVTHGTAHEPLYSVWNAIKFRTSNPKSNSYDDYGARGIKMHEAWVNDPRAFIEYVSALPRFAERDIIGLSLDRINNDGNYEPGNLRWATREEQYANSRRG